VSEADGIEVLWAEFEKALGGCADGAAVEKLRVAYLGRKGLLREAFAGMSGMDPESRKELGRRLNELRARIESALEHKGKATSAERPGPGDSFDATLPGVMPPVGTRHPIYQTMESICETFERMGFDVAYGPEIETEYHNFEALNIAKNHPSRDPWDSFYIDGQYLLRSHTSPVQIRTMLKRKPPLRIIAPGKVFRPDTVDASHLPQFHQVEGLVVEEGITFAHLKSVLDMWAKATYGKEVSTRFRPSYFPFTEPSAEMEISCSVCKAAGCAACKFTGWLEILGAGMVHPKVLENCGIDAERWTGFAFGMGVERIAMMRYGVRDIRLFVENRASFLDQF
jgi:phenylalanyl-tRNA synthetase alpha chain